MGKRSRSSSFTIKQGEFAGGVEKDGALDGVIAELEAPVWPAQDNGAAMRPTANCGFDRYNLMK
jgi:hypothetical protein